MVLFGKLSPLWVRASVWQGLGFVGQDSRALQEGWTALSLRGAGMGGGGCVKGAPRSELSQLDQGETLPGPQGQGRAIYCDFIAWVACPQPAGRGRIGAGARAGHWAHTMRPLCLSLSWQECRGLLAALEVSSLPPGLLRGGVTVGLGSQEALTTAKSLDWRLWTERLTCSKILIAPGPLLTLLWCLVLFEGVVYVAQT